MKTATPAWMVALVGGGKQPETKSAHNNTLFNFQQSTPPDVKLSYDGGGGVVGGKI